MSNTSTIEYTDDVLFSMGLTDKEFSKEAKKFPLAGKRADYAFYITPDFSQVKFIAEAKKPVNNLENKDYCFQNLSNSQKIF